MSDVTEPTEDFAVDDAPEDDSASAATAAAVCEYLVRAMVEDADAVRVEVAEGGPARAKEKASARWNRSSGTW